jgi:predicted phosphoribosyltransferase
VIALALPPMFRTVGEWYASFPQLNDAEVLALLDNGQDAR